MIFVCCCRQVATGVVRFSCRTFAHCICRSAKETSADRLVFENIKATDVYSSAVSIESWADLPIGEVTLRNLEVHCTPDAVLDPRIDRPSMRQDPIRKPGVGVWGRKLPVWGVYARNVENLVLDEVTLNTAKKPRPLV